MTEVAVCRVGLGLGVGRLIEGATDLAQVVDALDDLGFDSLWASEVLGSHAPDPVAALAFAAARTKQLKLGTSVMVAPGRSPAMLAKQAATLDLLSNGRFIPILGLGTADDDAVSATGVDRRDRGPITDEIVPLLRRIWAEDEVDHTGAFFKLNHYRPHIHPTRRSLPIWLGGRTNTELVRAGRLSDGWLASFATPDEVAVSIPVVRDAARSAGRDIEHDHYGVLLLYSLQATTPEVDDFIRWRRPDREKADLLPETPEQVVALLRAFAAAGASKFILVPASRPTDWERHLADLADVVDHVAHSSGGVQ